MTVRIHRRGRRGNASMNSRDCEIVDSVLHVIALVCGQLYPGRKSYALP